MSVVAFLLPHLRVLNPVADLKVLANTQNSDLLLPWNLNIKLFPVGIERAIRPWLDFLALWSMYKLFKAAKPDAVHTITPKAGLLGMIAAWMAGVPVRVHSFTGQVWVTKSGVMRYVLMAADFLIAYFATDILVDSPSQRQFLIDHRIIKACKSQVLGPGSICGVDIQRFKPDSDDRQALRDELGVSDNQILLLYLGRLNRDKGVLDLADAFNLLAEKNQSLVLIMVGPDEEDLSLKINSKCENFTDRVIHRGFTNTPERYMRAADLFCLPSYREGFGSSVIEAAASATPTIASKIYGLTDAVIDEQTGWLHRPGDVQDLAFKISYAASDIKRLHMVGNQARAHVTNKFSQELITEAMLNFYSKRLPNIS